MKLINIITKSIKLLQGTVVLILFAHAFSEVFSGIANNVPPIEILGELVAAMGIAAIFEITLFIGQIALTELKGAINVKSKAKSHNE